MKRDFTYVDDILDGIEIVLDNTDIPSGEIFNIGRGEQVALMDFIAEIEKNTGKEGPSRTWHRSIQLTQKRHGLTQLSYRH